MLSESTGRPRIEKKLITDLPVTSLREAIEKLGWYAQRWIIEIFHKIFKPGCRAEDARLRIAERIVNLIAISCILCWRILLVYHDKSHCTNDITTARTDRGGSHHS